MMARGSRQAILQFLLFLGFSRLKYSDNQISYMSKFQAIIVSFLALMFLSTGAGAVEVISRTQTPASTGNFGMLNDMMAFMGANWIWFVVIAGIAIVVIFIWKWLNSVKEKNNIFLRYFKEVVRLCGLQRNRKRVRERLFWIIPFGVGSFLGTLMLVIALVTDDVTAFTLSSSIFIVGIVTGVVLKFGHFFAHHDILQVIGQFGVKSVGWYEGECITADGYKNFLISNGRKWLFWKNKFVLRVNLNEKHIIETRDEKGKRELREYLIPKDNIIEGSDVIVIKGEGFDKANYFYYPLVSDKDGNIVNMDLIAFARAREVAMLDTLYQQTEDFARVQREAININPHVRYSLKTKGESVGGGSEGG